MRADRETREVAFHEAVHAATAYQLGKALLGVYADGSRTRGGNGSPIVPAYCSYVTPGIREPGRISHDDVLVYAAPGAAELKTLGRISDGTVADIQVVMESILQFDCIPMKPIVRAARRARRKSRDPRRQAEAFYQLIEPQVACLVDQVWPRITSLVDELLQHGHLSGREVAEYFEKQHGGTPPGALPAHEHFPEGAATPAGAWAHVEDLLKKTAREIRHGADLDELEVERFLTDLNSLRFRAAWIRARTGGTP